MNHANYYRHAAENLTLMARASHYPEVAAQFEAQARLYLSLARAAESPSIDLAQGLREFNLQQLRKDLPCKR